MCTWIPPTSSLFRASTELWLKPDDTPDIYYCRRVDSQLTVESTVAVMARLVDEELVKYLGPSEIMFC